MEVEDSEGKVALVVVVAIEQGELLGSVSFGKKAIDIENEGVSVRREVVDVVIFEGMKNQARIFWADNILQSTQGWLRGEPTVIVRVAVTDQLEKFVMAKGIGIVGVFIPEGHLINTLTYLLDSRMFNTLRVALIGYKWGNQ